jgi:methionyl-tRNA synthetase
MPKMIFAHGWWKVGEQKMSKSLGNIVDPLVVIRHLLSGQPYAADVYRYFLLREISFGQDGSFSEEALSARLSADLANDLGNLVNRSLSMIERYCSGAIPSESTTTYSAEDESLRQAAIGLSARVDEAMASVEFSAALAAIMSVVSHANRYIEAVAPWKLAKDASSSSRLHAVLHVLAEVIRIVAITLEPFLPSVAMAIWEQLGCGSMPRRLQDAAAWPRLTSGQKIGEHPVLFPQSEIRNPKSEIDR